MGRGRKGRTRLAEKGDAVSLGVEGRRQAADGRQSGQGQQQAHLAFHARQGGGVQQGQGQS